MKIHPSCSLCSRYDANNEFCTFHEETVNGMDQERPVACKEEGSFVRNMNVLLDSYHLYSEAETVPPDYKMDFSRLPKDKRGTPLFVMTKRGIERAIPAYPGLELTGDMLLGVSKVMTYQGQRDLIFDLGVELASSVAKAKGIELVVLEDEKNSKGKPEEIRRHQIYQQRMKAPNPWRKTAKEADWE